jgi:mRNA interferase YafQ
MILIKSTNAFEKDSKKLQKRGKDLLKLKKIVSFLVQGKTLPQKNKDHKLTGNYLGFRECHIEPDWLLIYQIDRNELCLVRTGSHSDLF